MGASLGHWTRIYRIILNKRKHLPQLSFAGMVLLFSFLNSFHELFKHFFKLIKIKSYRRYGRKAVLSIAFSLFSNVYHRVVQQLYRWTDADRFVGFSIDTVIHMHSTQLQKLSWTSFLPSGILSLSMMCVSAAREMPTERLILSHVQYPASRCILGHRSPISFFLFLSVNDI